jgi:hypothetical protein
VKALLGGAVVVALLASAAAGTTPKRVERVVVADAAGDLIAIAPSGARERLTRTAQRDSEPAVSFDGRRIAFVRDGVVHVLDLWTRRTTRLAEGTSPAWSPDGRVAYAAADGVRARDELLAPGAAEPAWSRDGRLALVLPDGIYVGGTLVAPGGRSPAWSPDARLAYTVGSEVYVDGRLLATGGAEPVWSPDGTRIAFTTPNGILVTAAEGDEGIILLGSTAGDTHPAWVSLSAVAPPPEVPKPDPNELLPDLDQRAPSGLTVSGWRGRWSLGFTSATDNVGRGPAWFRGIRPNGRTPTMRADQLIRLRNGKVRVVRDIGVMRYTWSSSHSHWHLLRFQQFELHRAADFALVVRDRKTGFCLADHYGLARHRVARFTGPHFFGNCGQGNPGALTIEQGTSIGYTDRYPAHFHGQDVDISRVPAGIYVLVHRANANGRLREVRTDNNAASIRIRLTRNGGVPRVRVLRVCEATERC